MGSSNSTTNHNSSTATLSPDPSKIQVATPSTTPSASTSKRKGFIRLVRRISSQSSTTNESSTDEILNDIRRINKTADIGKRIKNFKEREREREKVLFSYVLC